jgi:hypothetical protein
MRKKRLPLKCDRVSQDRFKRCMIFYGALLFFMLSIFVAFVCADSGLSSLSEHSRSCSLYLFYRPIRSREVCPVSVCCARAFQQGTPGGCLETMRGAKLIPPSTALLKRCFLSDRCVFIPFRPRLSCRQ